MAAGSAKPGASDGERETERGARRAPTVARPWGPRWFHGLVIALGLGYLVTIFLNSSGSRLPRDVLPRPALYFAQVACLFPHAAPVSIEYRLEAYSCSQRRFIPFDHRPYFPLHPNDKENRMHRAAHFYRRNAKVMHALDAYVVQQHNSRAPAQRAATGVQEAIGGISLMSLRIPFPPPGSRVERYRYDPDAAVPQEYRKLWYITPKQRRADSCGEVEE